MASLQQAKDTTVQKADETKQVGQEKGSQAQGVAQNLAGATKEKTSEAGQATQDKLGQTKQGTADATHVAQQKANESKQQTGNVLQQVGEQVKTGLEKAKETLTGGAGAAGEKKDIKP